MGRKWPGVKTRQKSIQIWFNWRGERVWETLEWTPIPANEERAGKLRQRIKTLIDLDAFNYAEYFPNSPRAQEYKTEAPIFFDVAKEWLASLSVLEDTIRDYKRIMNRRWTALYEMPIDQIDYSHITHSIIETGLNDKSAKTFNNEIIPLKATFKFARKMKYIIENPCEDLEYKQRIKEEPDPFSRDEANRIIDYFYDKEGAEWGEYFETAFYTGLRNPSEIIALPIQNIDFASRYIRIDSAVSRGTRKNHTKTRVKRDVHLNPRALSALRRARARHDVDATGPVFRHPSSGDEILTGGVQNDMWLKALRILGIRHRPMKNTRHTYATMMLEDTVHPSVAAAQLGHSVKMFLDVYTKWIDNNKTKAELCKIDAAVGERVAKSVALDSADSSKLLILK